MLLPALHGQSDKASKGERTLWQVDEFFVAAADRQLATLMLELPYAASSEQHELSFAQVAPSSRASRGPVSAGARESAPASRPLCKEPSPEVEPLSALGRPVSNEKPELLLEPLPLVPDEP